MTKAKISIILIFYNDAKYLSESIESILNQSFKNFELVMLDNGSTDGSRKIAETFKAKDSRIKIIERKENYHNGSLNFRILINETEGEYIRLFCADDIMKEECLEIQFQFMEKNKKYLACFSHMECIDNNSKDLGILHKSTIRQDRFEYLNYIFYSYSIFAFPTAMVRKNILKDEMLDPRLLQLADTKLWLKILEIGECYVINKNLVKYRHRKTGNVSNVKNSKRKINSYLFEVEIFYNEFTKFSNISEFKKIFPESRHYLDKIGNDTELLEFILAVLAYNGDKFNPFHFSMRRDIALHKIFKIISNEKLAAKIEKVFGVNYSYFHKLTMNYHQGLSYNFGTKKRSVIRKIFYKIFLRPKYKKLPKLNLINLEQN